MNDKKQTVVIGLSGGVDSSVAALLLKKQGYNVIGVIMQLCDKSSDISIQDAKNVADKLDMPFHVLDLRNEFKHFVINHFANEYIKGHTPNPCIECNKHLKFGLMLDRAQKLFNADYIATGHYAKIFFNNETNRYNIKQASSIKDQTYVLYNLTQEQLKHTLMPLGDYTKEQVRELALEFGFITANKKDSQEICFVEDNDYASFIEKNYNYTCPRGDFVDTKGNNYGKHKGIIHYTVGQRRGLGLSLKAPLYVKKLDSKTQQVVLASKDELFVDSLICKNINLITIDKLEYPLTAQVKIRYSAPKADATLIPIDENTIKVVFNAPVCAVTPGQAIVFYDEDIVIGGGIIQ